MELVMKYSGEDRDYFLSTNSNLKPFEFLVHKFPSGSESEVKETNREIFKSLVKRGLIYNDKNMSHLRTVNRDSFRMFIMKEYGIDMINIEKQMNEKYMESYNSSDSDDDIELPKPLPQTHSFNSSDSDSDLDSDDNGQICHNSSEEEEENTSEDDLI